jgi:hypothetical protein
MRFRLTASTAGGVTGFTPEAYDLPNNYVIQDLLINTTDSPQDVIYNITPVSPVGCNDGLSVNIKVTVNPTPRIFPVPVDTILCDSSLTRIRLRSPSSFTSGEVSFRFEAISPGGITGYTPSGAGFMNNHIIEDFLVNPTDAPQYVLYTITPSGQTGCNAGRSVSVRVTVNPTPRIFPVPENIEQCDSTSRIF